jgi:hypothetical protein
MSAVAGVAVILGVAVTVLRDQDRHVIIWVFNKSPFPLTHVGYSYTNGGAKKLFGRFVEASGETNEIVPGGFIVWDIEYSGQTNVTLSYTTPDGLVNYRYINIDVEMGYARPLNLQIVSDGSKTMLLNPDSLFGGEASGGNKDITRPRDREKRKGALRRRKGVSGGER